MGTRRRQAARAARIASLAAAVALAAGCTQPPLDVERLESAHPRLATLAAHHLWDTNPYLLPSRGELVFFLCRWPSETAIPVSLPPDASADERRALESVLQAWEGAGLGVRFETGAPPGVGIEIRFMPRDEATLASTYGGNTITDCAVDPEVFTSEPGDVLPAKLVFASVHLWRGGFDDVGRPRDYDEAVVIGHALHEFGHALGFQGHVKVGTSVMVKETDRVKNAGLARAKGEAFSDHTLRALYALPSGTVVARRAVEPYRTARVDQLAAIAKDDGLAGPFARVGDVDGQLSWQGPDGRRYALRFYDVRALLTGKSRLQVKTTRTSGSLLGGE